MSEIIVKKLSLDNRPQHLILINELKGFDLDTLLFRGTSYEYINSILKEGTDEPTKDFIYASKVEELNKHWPENNQNPFKYAYNHFGLGTICVYRLDHFNQENKINDFSWEFNNPNKKLDSLIAVFRLWNYFNI